MADKKVELVVARATRFKHDEHIIFTIDPQYRDILIETENLISDVFGVRAIGIPVPANAIKFYGVEGKNIISIEAPNANI